LGLLGRAEGFVLKGERALMDKAEKEARDCFEQAQQHLDDAWFIAERAHMLKYQMDCQLAYAQLALGRSRPADARKRLATARAQIEQTGYRRRHKKLQDLERALPP
jgi:hypothetical protein